MSCCTAPTAPVSDQVKMETKLSGQEIINVVKMSQRAKMAWFPKNNLIVIVWIWTKQLLVTLMWLQVHKKKEIGEGKGTRLEIRMKNKIKISSNHSKIRVQKTPSQARRLARL